MFPAKPELILDGGFALVVRRIAGMKGGTGEIVIDGSNRDAEIGEKRIQIGNRLVRIALPAMTVPASAQFTAEMKRGVFV